jgi:hypothetical protein
MQQPLLQLRGARSHFTICLQKSAQQCSHWPSIAVTACAYHQHLHLHSPGTWLPND